MFRLFAALGRPVDPALLTALLLDTLDGIRVPGVRRVVAVEPVLRCVPRGMMRWVANENARSPFSAFQNSLRPAGSVVATTTLPSVVTDTRRPR